MIRQVGASLRLVGRCRVIDIGRERYLRVDDDLLLLRKAQDDIGAEVVALRIFEVVLGEVVYPLDERRTIENRLEHRLAPVALHLRITTQGIREVCGLGRDALV